MKNVDYIIVGGGYAAIFFAHQLLQAQKSFVLYADKNLGGSHVSAGVVNPVVLKKFTTFWKAQEQIDFLHLTLKDIQKYTGENYFIDAPIHRVFHDENEKLLWSKKRKREDLIHFLDPEFSHVNGINNPHLTGSVNQSGRLYVKAFFEDMKKFLDFNNCLIQEEFDHHLVDIQNSTYKNICFSKIVFCEGMKVKNNPFFSDVPVVANKGHQIKVRLSEPVQQNITIKKKHFLFPVEDNLHFYGGTYDRDQLDFKINDSAVEQLKNGLSEIYPHNFTVENIQFGFRPTVKDRRPILGQHPEFKNLYVFNGLGARGILNGCYFSKVLLDSIENNNPLPEEVDLKRLYKIL